MQIEINNLPKHSNNEVYSMHWGKKKKVREFYEYMIMPLYEKYGGRIRVMSAKVHYLFEFKDRPLDCSNCAGMIKWIEDILFVEDNYRSINEITVRSEFNGQLEKEMRVTITITTQND